jgi:hypothetical protein
MRFAAGTIVRLSDCRAGCSCVPPRPGGPDARLPPADRDRIGIHYTTLRRPLRP